VSLPALSGGRDPPSSPLAPVGPLPSCPSSLVPHDTTVPSSSSAYCVDSPSATCVTLPGKSMSSGDEISRVGHGGLAAGPSGFRPQPTTEPSAFTTSVKLPAATDRTPTAAGGAWAAGIAHNSSEAAPTCRSFIPGHVSGSYRIATARGTGERLVLERSAQCLLRNSRSCASFGARRLPAAISFMRMRSFRLAM
jgi:hypothetical protein